MEPFAIEYAGMWSKMTERKKEASKLSNSERPRHLKRWYGQILVTVRKMLVERNSRK